MRTRTKTALNLPSYPLPPSLLVNMKDASSLFSLALVEKNSWSYRRNKLGKGTLSRT